MIVSLLATLLLQTTAAPAPAPTPAPAPVPVCTGVTSPPAGLEAWSIISGMTMGPVELGKGIAVHLMPSDGVKFALPPERAPAATSFSGVYTFQIATPGIYRIALESGAWIDVIRDGRPLKSVAHTMGPNCTGIRKIVDFDFAPGVYTLQLSGASAQHMRVLIAPK